MNLEITHGKLGSKNMQLVLTLLQNKLNSDFTTQESNPSCNKSGCCRGRESKLLQKVERGSSFCKKICTCCAFYRPKANLFCNRWCNYCLWRNSCSILSNQKSVFTQFATWFVARQVWKWVVKRATLLFSPLCGNVAKPVARFEYPFTVPLAISWTHRVKTHNRDCTIEVFRHFLRTANVEKSHDSCLAVRFAVWDSRLYG